MKQILRGNEWAEKLCAGLGLEPSEVNRIVIDARIGHDVMVYVEMVGTEQLLQVAPPDMKKVQISIINPPPRA